MKLIALVDGSPYSASVCDHAAWAAKRTGLDVELFHTLGLRENSSVPADLSGSLKLGARSSLLDKLAKSDTERAKLVHARGRMVLEDAAKRMTDAGVSHVEERLRNDTLVNTVRDFEADARVIVIGKRGESSALDHDHLGSNLERILRTATKPVLVANRAFQPIEKYLIAFDGSTSVMNSINRISGGTLLKGLDCRILHVGADTPEMRAGMEGAAAKLRTGGAEVTIEFRDGDPEQTIADAVGGDGADLLVIGAYGRRRLRRLFLGSVSAQMAHMCKVPVMVFK